MSLPEIPDKNKVTVSCASTLALLRFCEQKKIQKHLQSGSVKELDIGIAPDRIATSDMVTIWSRAQSVLKSEPIGLKVAAYVPFGAYKMLDYLIASAHDLNDVLQKNAQFFSLANGGAELFVFRRKDTVVVELNNLVAPQSHIKMSADFTFALFLSRLQLVTGRRILPLAVHFTFDNPFQDEDYVAALGCIPLFLQSGNRLIFSATALAVKTINADKKLSELLMENALNKLSMLNQEGSFIHKVREAMNFLVSQQKYTLMHLAKEFSLSDRSMQRILHSFGTSFRDLLSEVRCEQALYYLHEKNLSVKETAFYLGFSDDSAFCRSYKSWMGFTPKADVVNYSGGTPLA